MPTWTDRRITDLFGIELPIIQAPMAGAQGPELTIAVGEAGGLGSLPVAQLNLEQARAAIAAIRKATLRPINLNFFSHEPSQPDPVEISAWHKRLHPYYRELGIDVNAPVPTVGRTPFDAGFAALVEEVRPEVVSFHFGLPDPALVARVRATGAKIISSATTVAEARWLCDRGVDAIIAMGSEAGGHRGNFLSDDMNGQVGLMALLPQVVDAVPVPVIAAGGISDGRGIAAAFALGASAVQIGTAYLFTPEAKISAPYRAALQTAGDSSTALTNLFSGRPARGIVNRLMREQGPLRTDLPRFPYAGGPLLPLRSKAEAMGSGDFTNLWAGQAVHLGRDMPAAALTKLLWAEAQKAF
jgi:nitronate monooxygenase